MCGLYTLGIPKHIKLVSWNYNKSPIVHVSKGDKIIGCISEMGGYLWIISIMIVLIKSR